MRNALRLPELSVEVEQALACPSAVLMRIETTAEGRGTFVGTFALSRSPPQPLLVNAHAADSYIRRVNPLRWLCPLVVVLVTGAGVAPALEDHLFVMGATFRNVAL